MREEEASWEPTGALPGPPGSFLGVSWGPLVGLWGLLEGIVGRLVPGLRGPVDFGFSSSSSAPGGPFRAPGPISGDEWHRYLSPYIATHPNS